MGKYYAVVKGIKPGVYNSWPECEAQVKGFPGASYKGFTSEKDAQAYYEDNTKSASNNTKADVKLSAGKIAENIDYDEVATKAYESLSYLHDNGFMSDSEYARYQNTIKLQTDGKKAYQASVVDNQTSNKYDGTHIDIFVDGSYNKNTQDVGYGVYMTDGMRQQILAGYGPCAYGGNNIEGEVAGATKGLEYVSMFPQYKSVTIYHDYQGVSGWANGWAANLPYTKLYAEFVDKMRANGLKVDFEWTPGHTGIEGNEVVDKLAKMACGVPLTSSEEKFIGKYASVPGYEQANQPKNDLQNTLTHDFEL